MIGRPTRLASWVGGVIGQYCTVRRFTANPADPTEVVRVQSQRFRWGRFDMVETWGVVELTVSVGPYALTRRTYRLRRPAWLLGALMDAVVSRWEWEQFMGEGGDCYRERQYVG